MSDRIKLQKKINPNVSAEVSEILETEKQVLFRGTHSEFGSPSKRASIGANIPNARSSINSSKGERGSIKSSLRNSKEYPKDAVMLTEQSRVHTGNPDESRAKSPALPTKNDTAIWRDTVNRDEGSPSKVNTSASFRDSLEMIGGKKEKVTQNQKVLAKKNLQQDYDVVIVPIIKETDMDTKAGKEDVEAELRKQYFESLAKKKKDDEEEQEKQKKLTKARRAVESIGRGGAGGQPAYTYGYNGEIMRTKNTLSPLKKDLMIKPKFEVSVISKVIPKPSPAQSIHGHTLSTHQSGGNSNPVRERRGSLEGTNKFVEMLRGYGIKVALDPKTYAPIITDAMIKELERKTKGKMLDQIDLKPGVKFIEPSPEKEKERVKERGLFMTQYDAQTGFPRITKKIYNQVKGTSEILEKTKIEAELAKINASHITPEPHKEPTDSRKESMDETDFTHPSSGPNGRQSLQPLKNKPKLPPTKAIAAQNKAQGDQEMTFAEKEIKAGKPPLRTASANPRGEAAKLPKPSNNTVRSQAQKGGEAGKLDMSLPLNSNLIDRQRKEQLITKKNWRVRSSHRPEKSLLSAIERGSITTGRDTSFDVSYSKNMNGTKIGEKKEKEGDVSRSNNNDHSVHIENQKYLDLLDL